MRGRTPDRLGWRHRDPERCCPLAGGAWSGGRAQHGTMFDISSNCVSFATDSMSRQRDVFPLPPFADFLDSEGSGESSCAKRRALKRCHVGRWCEELSGTLNEMCGIDRTMHAGQRSTLSQRLVMRHIRDSVAACGEPPRGLTGREALHALLAKQGYSGGTTAQLDIDLLSLPSGQLEPVPLATLMGPEGQEAVQQFISSSVLPKSAARAKIAECEVKNAYMDPLLREDPRAYGRLLSRFTEVAWWSGEGPAQLVSGSSPCRRRRESRG